MKGVSDATYHTMTCVVAYQVVSINHPFVCLIVHSFVDTGNPRSLICVDQRNLELPRASRSRLKSTWLAKLKAKECCDVVLLSLYLDIL